MLRFAEDSGLVFKETTVSGVKHKCRNYTPNQCRGRKPGHTPPKKGTNSLQKTALRVILCNLGRMDDQSMSTLPHRIVHQIWHAANRAELQSLQAWKLFVHTDIADANFMHSWRTGCERCSVLPRAVDAALGLQPVWLTSLTLQDHIVTAMDMTYISRLTNLQALNIDGTSLGARNHSSSLNDSILRTWAAEAKTGIAFQKLEMIFINGQTEVTQWAFQYLNDFPSLYIFCPAACGIPLMLDDGATKRRYGWYKQQNDGFVKFGKTMPSLGRSIAGYPSSGNIRSHIGASDRFVWSSVVDAYITHTRGLRTQQIVEQPVLNVYVGQSGEHEVSFTSVTCFERDWTFTAGQVLPVHAFKRKGVLGGEITRKRKLRDGKAMALNDMLLDLE
nr:hypothetical protein CFP56_42132 [Quercus suber]